MPSAGQVKTFHYAGIESHTGWNLHLLLHRYELTRTHEANGVSVEIVPLNLYDAVAETVEFEIIFTTHSVDLNYDFAALATLRSDAGVEVAALKWDGPMGGHHVYGVLSFPALQARGQTITLTLRDIAAAPERSFVWPAKQ